MFGMLKPNLRLATTEDRTRYSGLYCNLCGTLSEDYGVSSRLLTAYDLVTLVWLLTDDMHGHERFRRLNCMRGGTFRPRTPDRSDRDRLASALSMIMCDIRLADDVQDRGSLLARGARRIYAPRVRRARQELIDLGFSVAELDTALAEQARVERRCESDLNAAAGPTGICYGLAASALVRASGEQPETARMIGDRLGRLVYLIDAFRDRHEDGPGDYNPLCCSSGRRLRRVSSSRLREFDQHAGRLFSEAGDLCDAAGGRTQTKWSLLRQSLIAAVARDPESVTLNFICCLPCGQGAVAVDSREVRDECNNCAVCLSLLCILHQCCGGR